MCIRSHKLLCGNAKVSWLKKLIVNKILLFMVALIQKHSQAHTHPRSINFYKKMKYSRIFEHPVIAFYFSLFSWNPNFPQNKNHQNFFKTLYYLFISHDFIHSQNFPKVFSKYQTEQNFLNTVYKFFMSYGCKFSHTFRLRAHKKSSSMESLYFFWWLYNFKNLMSYQTTYNLKNVVHTSLNFSRVIRIILSRKPSNFLEKLVTISTN